MACALLHATLSSLVCAHICPTSFLHLSCPADSIFPATILCTLCHVKLLLSYCTFVVRRTVLSTLGYKLLTLKIKIKKALFSRRGVASADLIHLVIPGPRRNPDANGGGWVGGIG